MKIFKMSLVKMVAIFCVLFSMLGCASVVVPYTTKIKSAKDALRNNDQNKLNKTLEDLQKSDKTDKSLLLIEGGRAAQIVSAYGKSKSQYAESEAIVKQKEMEAKIKVSNIASSTASLLTNDNIIPYTILGYEKIFLYHYQALNYLFENDVQDALVEGRRADQEQEFQRRLHYKEATELKEAAKKRKINVNTNRYNEKYKNMLTVASMCKNSYQNPYTFYLTGLLYELQEDYQDALIDYKKALQIASNNKYIQLKISEMLYKLGDNKKFEDFSKKNQLNPKFSDDNGELVILYEEDFVPEREPIMLPISIGHVIQMISFPTYRHVYIKPNLVTVSDEDSRLGKTQMIVNVQILAAKALKEEMPMILFRQILRMTSKQIMTQQAGKYGGTAAGIFANIFGLVTSMPDLRSWTLLPDNAQIFQKELKPKTYAINLQGDNIDKDINVNIEKGKKTILWIINTNKVFHVNVQQDKDKKNWRIDSNKAIYVNQVTV